MKQDTLEPGLLSVFRIFTGLRLGFALLTTLFHVVLQQQALNYLAELTAWPLQPFLASQHTQPSFLVSIINIADVLILGIYLWWPLFQRRLGRFFLPIGLGLATVGPL